MTTDNDFVCLVGTELVRGNFENISSEWEKNIFGSISG